MGRIPTKSWLKGKRPILIPVEKIKPTNNLTGDVLRIQYSPIMLVKSDNDLYYIVDGNHRFFKKLFTRNKELEAWVLEKHDRKKLFGDPLPEPVREWKEGKINLSKLSDMAKDAYKSIQFDINPVLDYWFSAKEKEIEVVESFMSVRDFEGRDLEILALSLLNSILKIIQGTSSIKKESLVNRISKEDLSILYICFMEGGVKAVRKSLKGVLKPKGEGAGKQYPLFPGK